MRAALDGGVHRQSCTDDRTLMLDLSLKPLLFFFIGSEQQRVVPQTVRVVDPRLDVR